MRLFRRKRPINNHSIRVSVVGQFSCRCCLHAHEGGRCNGDITCTYMTNLFRLSKPKIVYDSNNKLWHRWNNCPGFVEHVIFIVDDEEEEKR